MIYPITCFPCRLFPVCSLLPILLEGQNPEEWEVVVWDWTHCMPNSNVSCTPKPSILDITNLKNYADVAYNYAWIYAGPRLANDIEQYFTKYKYIHLIAHSAGSKLIDKATNELAKKHTGEKRDMPFIYLTFLDAYTQKNDDINTYGSLPNKYPHYAEHYVDRSLNSVFAPTDACLKNAFNFDITYWPHFEPEGFPFGHLWPLNWYKKSITSIPRFQYGHPLSLEGSGKDINELISELAQYPAGKQCSLSGEGTNCQPADCWKLKLKQ